VDWDALYAQARLELGLARGMRLRPKPFRVLFRPLAGIRGTIYHRGDHYEVRVSDLLREAPAQVHASLAKLLVGKMERRLRATPAERAPYLAWCRDPANLSRHDEARRERGRKRLDPPRGRVHDLEGLFDRLNADYFDGALPRPRLGWSRRVSRRLYAHHDPVHDAIVVNRLLDHPRVPATVVADILHHEMLHVKHGVASGAGGRRVIHSRAFKEDERRFDGHDEAKRWLKDLEARRIRIRPLREPPASNSPSPATGLARIGSLGRILQATLDAWSKGPRPTDEGTRGR
jgi:hypothetical protein